MSTDWNADDDTPLDVLLAEYQAKYGKAVAAVIAKSIAAGPPPRKDVMLTRAKDCHGRVVRRVVGNAENPDAEPSAVDFRHHRSRIERGK